MERKVVNYGNIKVMSSLYSFLKGRNKIAAQISKNKGIFCKQRSSLRYAQGGIYSKKRRCAVAACRVYSHILITCSFLCARIPAPRDDRRATKYLYAAFDYHAANPRRASHSLHLSLSIYPSQYCFHIFAY